MYMLGILDQGFGSVWRVVFLCQEDIARWLRPFQAEEIMVL
jgi:hypothetical protein